jgi:hypothetical protein
MIKYILITLLAITLNGQSNFTSSFITKFEYGKMLYFNPRGISCSKCHGNDALGITIATFKHTRQKKEYICKIKTHDITHVTYSKFLRKLDSKLKKYKKKFKKDEVCKKLTYKNSMPTYFLTKDELNSIFFYLTNKDKN